MNLPLEALGGEERCQLGRQDFDDDTPAQPGLKGDEHAGHPAAAEFPFDRVVTAKSGLQPVAQFHTRAS